MNQNIPQDPADTSRKNDQELEDLKAINETSFKNIPGNRL
jgi:hypothetical protein